MGTQPRKGFARVVPLRPEREDDLVTVPSEPTLEQCENVAAVMGFPILPESMRPPFYRESMLRLHALVVRMLNGDEEATRIVETLKAAFGRRAENGHPNARKET